MRDDPSKQALRQLQAIIARETGVALPDAAQAEIIEVIRQARGTEPRQDASAFVCREVTILMADLRGSTAMASTQPAGVVISMLNRCLDRMGEVIQRHGGTIDKFMGDSIMVLFGAPVEREDDVLRALACAIEMQQAMRRLNDDFREQELPALYMGIGINSGAVMAGRFHCADFSEYTVIGDEVNLAARIEAFSLRGQILVSENTYRRCAPWVCASAPMEVYVKGKSRPVSMRELLSIPSRQLEVPRQEIRRSHRAAVKLPCSLHRIENNIVMPHVIQGMICDLGYHGALLGLGDVLEPHTEVKIEFDLPLIDYHASDIYAKVVTAKGDGADRFAGLEFTSVDAQTTNKIELFVQFLVGAQ